MTGSPFDTRDVQRLRAHLSRGYPGPGATSGRS